MQRITIAIIAVVLVFGTLGTYLLVIWQNNNSTTTQSNPNTAATDASQQQKDPTAYIVHGTVASLQEQDLTVGTGTAVQAGDTVRVHYKGTIAQTGVKFDSSYDRGEPLTISLKGVIPGWQQGMVGMRVGGKRRLIIPASLAYGNQPPEGSIIPANADLVFEIELLAVNPTQ